VGIVRLDVDGPVLALVPDESLLFESAKRRSDAPPWDVEFRRELGRSVAEIRILGEELEDPTPVGVFVREVRRVVALEVDGNCNSM
jgi:hypothetical protein